MLWPFPLAGTLPSWAHSHSDPDRLRHPGACARHHPRKPPAHHGHGLAAGHLLRAGPGPGALPAFRQFPAVPQAAARSRKPSTPGSVPAHRNSQTLESRYDGPEWVGSAAELNKTLGLAAAWWTATAVELLPGYPDSITAMAAAVRGAKDFVNAEFYIMSTRPRHRRSADRAGRGGRARRRGPRPVRPPRHAPDQGLQQTDRPAEGQQDPLAAHAAAAPRARASGAARICATTARSW